jgi:hypothetical protein
MPRPCAVEFHAYRYTTGRGNSLEMPRPCAVEFHVYLLKVDAADVAHLVSQPLLIMVFPISNKRETPRHKAVAS